MPSTSSRAGSTSGYDPVAGEYASQFFNELRYKPFDCALLDRFADLVRDLGPVCDLGCGPGQVARYLNERGIEAFGVDLSGEMVKEARRLSPGIRFERGDMRNLQEDSSALGGIAAFYSLIHISPTQLPHVLSELHRVLKKEGRLIVAFHIGDEIIHLDEWWEMPVDLDFHFFQLADLETMLLQAGFAVEESLSREPYDEVEHPSQRGYILARKP